MKSWFSPSPAPQYGRDAVRVVPHTAGPRLAVHPPRDTCRNGGAGLDAAPQNDLQRGAETRAPGTSFSTRPCGALAAVEAGCQHLHRGRHLFGIGEGPTGGPADTSDIRIPLPLSGAVDPRAGPKFPAVGMATRTKPCATVASLHPLLPLLLPPRPNDHALQLSTTGSGLIRSAPPSEWRRAV